MDETGSNGTISAPRLRTLPLVLRGALSEARGPLLTAALRSCAPFGGGGESLDRDSLPLP